MAPVSISYDQLPVPDLVSCILPVYNGERFLRESLQSILAQSYRPIEILVVDDGSTDRTPQVASSFGPRVRYVRQENAGPAAARNHALHLARGEFVAFQDSDDVWLPEKLSRQVDRLRERSDLDFCVTLIQNFWMDELSDEARHFQGYRFADVLPGYVLMTLVTRRSFFERIGGFDPKLRVGSDTDWFLRARDARAIEELIPELHVRRRLHAGNLTRTDLASRETLLHSLKASLERRREQS